MKALIFTALLIHACLAHLAFARSKVPKMTVLHADARIFLFENFLSDGNSTYLQVSLPAKSSCPARDRPLLWTGPVAEECDHIISLAKPRMERSGVMEDHSTTINDYRTSSGTFLDRGEDPIIAGAAGPPIHRIFFPSACLMRGAASIAALLHAVHSLTIFSYGRSMHTIQLSTAATCSLGPLLLDCFWAKRGAPPLQTHICTLRASRGFI
jgi:hypothetical protein